MNTTTTATPINQIFLWGAGILAAALVVTNLLGVKIPFLSGDRNTFFALAVLGFIMCTFGSWSKSQPINWLSPIILAGMLLGILAVALTLSLIFKFQLPLITSERTAVLALTGIIVLKVVLSAALKLFSRTA